MRVPSARRDGNPLHEAELCLRNQSYAVFLAFYRRTEQGLAEDQRAQELDPLSPSHGTLIDIYANPHQ